MGQLSLAKIKFAPGALPRHIKNFFHANLE
jgi:hypothetical protein